MDLILKQILFCKVSSCLIRNTIALLLLTQGCARPAAQVSEIEARKSLERMLNSVREFLDVTPDLEIAKVSCRNSEEIKRAICTVHLRDGSFCEYDSSNEEIMLFRSATSCGDPQRNANGISDERTARDICLKFIGRLLPQREARVRKAELCTREMFRNDGCWEAVLEPLHNGIPYLGADIRIYLSASSGKVLEFSQIPVEAPLPYEVRCSQEEAERSTSEYLGKDLPDSAFEIAHKTELFVVPSHLPMFSSVRSATSGDVRALSSEGHDPRVVWHVWAREKDGGNGKEDEHRRLTVEAFVDVNNGLVLGLFPLTWR